MYRFVVITDWTTSPGFKLGGAEVFEAATGPQAQTLLSGFLADREVGVIAVNERFLGEMDDEVRRKMETVDFPVIVPFPDPSGEGAGMGDERLSLLIRRAIGYSIRLRQ